MSYSGSRRSRDPRRRSADHGDDLGSGRELALYNPVGWDVAPYDVAPYDAAAAEYPYQGSIPRPQSPAAALPSITSSRHRSPSLVRIISSTARLTITSPPPNHQLLSPAIPHRPAPPPPRHRSRPPSPRRHRSPPPPRRHRSRPPSPSRHRTTTRAPTVASGAEYESDGPDYGALDRHPPPSFLRGPRTRVFINGREVEPEFRYEIGGTAYPDGAWLFDGLAPANWGSGAGAGAGGGGDGGGSGSGRHDGGRRRRR
ncbi:uncharacterized protein THITE_2088824 [Thermothielavioides terrestris NRRL 8126]|uniref:Uncharacterized protein n=1 Tax=Thermothielavioides terrestris (strain ATCC 38088 / NRRL 8126) TaxID=578455 RepID=G2R0S5_THETT|nr:uncharacterized protein THITE_2088824 [Thermothielavioides terrestris NRRL 8126]AEO67336.1 hypothetical protein THITE_2088824 [Thermothielavioides terrestris NRRL 8126]